MTWAEYVSTFFIALSLSADCFAVSLGAGCGQSKIRYIRVFRTALAFGIAQAVMPTLGWLAGRTVFVYIAGLDHWIAFGLLAVVGGRMIWEAFKGKEDDKAGMDITRGWLLFILAVATSIDALAVGLSLAFLKTNIWLAALIIGVMAFSISNLGFYLGRKAGDTLGKRAKFIGGLILIGIGLRVLISHLLV
jgi:manganese efflux pump family protein